MREITGRGHSKEGAKGGRRFRKPQPMRLAKQEAARHSRPMQEAGEHTISVRFERVTPLIDSARASGVDVEKLFSALNLPVRLVENGRNEFISLADYYRLQNRLSILIGDETVHLSSRQLLPGSTDFVLAHLSDCKNLFEVMGVVAKSYNLLHGGQFNQVEKRRASVDYLIDDRDFPYAGMAAPEDIYFQCECILIFLHCLLMVISPSARDALQIWLDGLGALEGAADNTRTAYRGDVVDFLAFMSLHFGGPQELGALSQITTADMRAWMASSRNAGTGARSLARKLSAVKKFYGWLAKREGFEPTAVLSTRSPKFQKKLPRPLDKDAARAMIDTVELQSQQDWVAARDVAF